MTQLPVFCWLIVYIIIGTTPTFQADNSDRLVGRWLSAKKKNQVEIYRQGNRYYGKLVWMAEPVDILTSKPKLDKRNPSEKSRMRPLLNLPIITNLAYKGDNTWEGGQIYNPEDGRTYSCQLTLADANTLNLHGYVMGMTFLGKTAVWTRVPDE